MGVGDTVASVCGVLYGSTRWPGTKKTVLGTVAGALAQLILVLVLCWTGAVLVPGGEEAYLWWSGVVISVLVCSVMEAFTHQVDNIALPLLMFIGISVTELLTL